MVRLILIVFLLPPLALCAAGAMFSPAAAQESEAVKRIDHVVDTPFYTLRGPDVPIVALIQTGEEVEYIGDYLGLDSKRASSALRLLRHVDFDETMLLVINGGPVENGMLRVDSVYEENGELNVVVVFSDPPLQYQDFDSGVSPNHVYYPSLVSILPRFQGRLVVHIFPTEWLVGGDLRGINLLIRSTTEDDTPEGESG